MSYLRTLLPALALLAGCAPVTTRVADDDDTSAACIEGLAPGQCPPDFTMQLAGGGEFALNTISGATRVIVIGSSNW